MTKHPIWTTCLALALSAGPAAADPATTSAWRPANATATKKPRRA